MVYLSDNFGAFGSVGRMDLSFQPITSPVLWNVSPVKVAGFMSHRERW